ncbi:MAG: hypothetical protein WCJ81_09110 [bacterium]
MTDKDLSISVWLEPTKLRNTFRCCRCGKIVFEYYGDIKSIVVGENEIKSPVVVQCKGSIEKKDYDGGTYYQKCHTKYIIS